MNTSKILSVVAALGLAGSISLAQAQSSTTDATGGADSTTTTTPDSRNPASMSERSADTTGTTAVDTRDGDTNAAGSTMYEEQVARADRN